MPRKLHNTVFRASLRFQKRFPDAVRSPCTVSISCTRSCQNITYRKILKFSDAKKRCCNLPKIQTKRPNLKEFCQKHANGIANSEDPDPTAPLPGSSLIWVCTVCPDLSVRKFRIITVHCVILQNAKLSNIIMQNILIP